MNIKLNHARDWLALAQKANWSVGKVAKSCSVSVRALELHFLKNFAQTPKSWMAEQRQKQAIGILRNGSCVKETAVELGYKHAHHFSRDFKKQWGYCPMQIVTKKRIKIPNFRNLVHFCVFWWAICVSF